MLRLVQSLCRYSNKYLQPRLSTTVHCKYTTNPEINNQTSDFTPVYKFRYIRVFGVINRLKLYQTVLTLGGVPASLALSIVNVVDSESVYVTGALGLTGCIVLYTVGFLTERFIGFVYINNKNQAKVSYLDFWGRRKDTEFPIDDIVPFSDMPAAVTDGLFLKFRTFTSENTLRISLKYGEVLDKEGFNKVFLRTV